MRMGQAHVKRWIDDLMRSSPIRPIPSGFKGFATHGLPREQAPHGYEIFRDKGDGCIKAVPHP